MASLYADAHRALQDEFGTTRLAARLDESWVHEAIQPEEAAFIAARDMFFLSTVDPDGSPTVSYKGGPTGLVRVLDPRTLAFPGYDGNGMFLSLGNIAGQAKVGLLFIDFETPHRVRVQGEAEVVRDDPLMAGYPEAKYLVRVAVAKIWANCPRYVHRYEKVAQSKYVPRAGRETPLAAWKRLDLAGDVIAEADKARVAREGRLTDEAYAALFARGEA